MRFYFLMKEGMLFIVNICVMEVFSMTLDNFEDFQLEYIKLQLTKPILTWLNANGEVFSVEIRDLGKLLNAQIISSSVLDQAVVIKDRATGRVFSGLQKQLLLKGVDLDLLYHVRDMGVYLSKTHPEWVKVQLEEEAKNQTSFISKSHDSFISKSLRYLFSAMNELDRLIRRK